jgi:hypothetical protein
MVASAATNARRLRSALYSTNRTPGRLALVNSTPQGPAIMAELLAKSPTSAEWWVVSCGDAIIIMMIDRTIANVPSPMSLGGIAPSKRSVDNFALIQRVTGSLCSWRRLRFRRRCWRYNADHPWHGQKAIIISVAHAPKGPGEHYMNTEIRVVVISAVTALITSGLVAVVDYTVRKRESDIKMMEIAVDLLKADPNGPLQPARAWAVDVIRYYSKDGVPLSDDAGLALGSHSLVTEEMVVKDLKERTLEGLSKLGEIWKREHGGQAPSKPAPE